MSKLLLHFLKPRSLQRSSEHTDHWLGWLVKLVMSLAVMAFIYFRFLHANENLNVHDVLGDLKVSLLGGTLIIASILVMCANWALEVVKWKLLVSSQWPLSWRKAVKGVLSGITFGLFTPNRMGEFIGRVLVFNPDQRIAGGMLSLLNGIAQTIATLSFGLIGMFVLLFSFGIEVFGQIPTLVLQLTLLITWIFSMVIYYRVDWVSRLLLYFDFMKKFEPSVMVLTLVPNIVLSKLYVYSLLRFLTFLMQYQLVFQIFFPMRDPLEVLTASMLSLFSITLLPFIPVPDLLLRESLAISFFDLYAFDPIEVGIVVFVVWALNVAIPAILGSVTLFTYRLIKPKS